MGMLSLRSVCPFDSVESSTTMLPSFGADNGELFMKCVVSDLQKIQKPVQIWHLVKMRVVYGYRHSTPFRGGI